MRYLICLLGMICFSAHAYEVKKLESCYTGIGCPGVVWEIKHDGMRCIAIENVNDTHKAISCVQGE